MAEKRIETVEMRAGDVKTGFGNPEKLPRRKRMNSDLALRPSGILVHSSSTRKIM